MSDFNELAKMRRRALPIGGPARAALAKAAGRPPEVRLEIGVVETPGGKAYVGIKLGAEQVILSADRAEELAVDLRNFAIEVRNGGALT